MITGEKKTVFWLPYHIKSPHKMKYKSYAIFLKFTSISSNEFNDDISKNRLYNCDLIWCVFQFNRIIMIDNYSNSCEIQCLMPTTQGNFFMEFVQLNTTYFLYAV